jgi:hypothetical protein
MSLLVAAVRKTPANESFVLSQNPGTGEGTLFIGDCDLSRQLGEYEQRAALEAAAQL